MPEKMYSIKFTESDLNVEYTPKFIQKEDADHYFTQLQALPYYTPTFVIRGRSVKPKRQVLAFGDENTAYTFSGTTIPAVPWSPLMIELRNLVEKQVGCTFNYVLLNLYPNGSSYISQHKDAETGIDTTFPIAVLSFGGERTIEFKRPKMKSTLIKLQHGSLYCLMNPTNQLFTHGIAAEPGNKAMRISLTFRHLIATPTILKRPRLQLNSSGESDSSTSSIGQNDSKDCLADSNDCVLDSNDCLSEPTKEFDEMNDWLTTFFDKLNPVHMQWNINRDTFIQILLEKNCHLRICFQKFKQLKTGEWVPSKRKYLKMTPETWFIFQGKISNIKFESVDESFISNNQLLTACVDRELCLMQQIFPLNTEGFFLKPTIMKLYKDQVSILLQLAYEINEALIEARFLKQLPSLILSKYTKCRVHMSEEDAKQNFLTTIFNEIYTCSNFMYQCEGCFYNRENKHECLDISPYDKFNRNRQKTLLYVNLYAITKTLSEGCLCHYNDHFFKQFDLTFYNNWLENKLSSKMDV